MNIALFFDRHHEHTTGVYFERALKSMNTMFGISG